MGAVIAPAVRSDAISASAMDAWLLWVDARQLLSSIAAAGACVRKQVDARRIDAIRPWLANQSLLFLFRAVFQNSNQASPASLWPDTQRGLGAGRGGVGEQIDR